MDPNTIEELKNDYAKDLAAALASKFNQTPEETEETVKVISRMFDLIITPYL